MSNSTKNLTPLTSAIGATLASALALGSVQAAENPFGLSELEGGYMQVAMEGKCAGNMGTAAKGMAEGKCGAGKCGGSMMKAKAKMNGKCGGNMGAKGAMDGKCGGSMGQKAKRMMQGKCGTGKCGGSK